MSPTNTGMPDLGRGKDVVRLAAGLADVGLEQAEGLLRRVRGVLSRRDHADLAADAHADLLARGDVVLGRLGSGSEAHMETLARIAEQRKNRDLAGDAPGGSF